MMRKYSLLFCIFLAFGSLHAEIYKWTDRNGNVHFSDKPHPGAEEIILPKTQTYSSPAAPHTDTPVAKEESEDEKSAYETFTIAQPEDQVTIRSPQGYVSILIDLKPELRPGDKLQILVDGTPIDKPRATTVFALQDVHRGSHTLAAQLSDAKGNIVGTTDPITIFMMPPREGMAKNSP